MRATGRRFLALQADLSQTAPLSRLVHQAMAEFGRLDILVNNAGIIRRAGAANVTEEDWDAVLDTNLKSMFFLSQAAARHMLAHGGGKIPDVASLLCVQARLARALAHEWAAHGVNVNPIAPGYFETNNTAALRADAEREPQILTRMPASPGSGRHADMIYDRAGSAFAGRAATSYDWDSLLAGAGWLHVSGVTPAVSAEAEHAALDAVRAASRLGVRVSCDGNYRAKLWEARGESGAAILRAIVKHADLAFIEQRDIALPLGDPALANGARADAVAAAMRALPRLGAIAATTRVQHSIERHQLSAALYTHSGVAAAGGI